MILAVIPPGNFGMVRCWTASTATFLPILGAVAVGLTLDPRLLVIPVAVGASMAFMMPVATPPNAIIQPPTPP